MIGNAPDHATGSAILGNRPAKIQCCIDHDPSPIRTRLKGKTNFGISAAASFLINTSDGGTNGQVLLIYFLEHDGTAKD